MELISYNQTYAIDNFKTFNIIHTLIAAILFIIIVTLSIITAIITKKPKNIKDIKDIKLSKDKTTNEIVKRGLLEKIFGGVGTQQELPTTP